MKKILKYLVIIGILGITIVLAINFYVILSTRKQIQKDNSEVSEVECILVLGAGIWGDKPSPMLEDRLDKAIKLYKRGIAKKIIMSGDHGQTDYDEVNIMKQYAIKKGVPSEDIFMDHAGFSTYESIYRAKEIFKVKKMVIVTQEYHLYRAIYIANKLDVYAVGINADPRKYAGAIFREFREILARNKDFITTIFKPKPTFLGSEISVNGNGDVTNDK